MLLKLFHGFVLLQITLMCVALWFSIEAIHLWQVDSLQANAMEMPCWMASARLIVALVLIVVIFNVCKSKSFFSILSINIAALLFLYWYAWLWLSHSVHQL